jgi:hypothetical protein
MDPDPGKLYGSGSAKLVRYIDILYFRICNRQNCGQRLENVKSVAHGGGLTIRSRCGAGHESSWNSCAFFNDVNNFLNIRLLCPVYFLIQPCMWDLCNMFQISTMTLVLILFSPVPYTPLLQCFIMFCVSLFVIPLLTLFSSRDGQPASMLKYPQPLCCQDWPWTRCCLFSHF